MLSTIKVLGLSMCANDFLEDVNGTKYNEDRL